MAKVNWKPGNMIYPLPAVMVSVGNSIENYNIITIAWTGTICSDPPMCYISVRPGRHSYQVLKDTGEFVINLTTKELAYATDWCGVRSGRQYDKFEEMHLTPGKSMKVNAPTIEEAPINVECKVLEVKQLGTHDMFIAEVVTFRQMNNTSMKIPGHLNYTKQNRFVIRMGIISNWVVNWANLATLLKRRSARRSGVKNNSMHIILLIEAKI